MQGRTKSKRARISATGPHWGPNGGAGGKGGMSVHWKRNKKKPTQKTPKPQKKLSGAKKKKTELNWKTFGFQRGG